MDSLLSSLLSAYDRLPSSRNEHPEPEPEPRAAAAPTIDAVAVQIPPSALAACAPAKHVAVGLAGRKFAIPVDFVLEAGRYPRTTFVPGLPPHVRGVFNFRGEIIPVIDVRTLVGLDPLPHTHESRILTAQKDPKSNKAALVFDSLEGIVNLAPETSRPGAGDAALFPFLNGVCHTESGELGLINMERILTQAGCLETDTDPTQ